MVTQQEIFTRVASHLLAQNRRSFLHGRCAYRGDNGDMCAVGCLITDEAYTPNLEGCTVGKASVIRALEASGISVEHTGFLAELQEFHDNTIPTFWRQSLEYFAKSHDLVMP